MKKVIFNLKDVVSFSNWFIQSLKQKAFNSSGKTIRQCLHKNNNELVHEMIIVHSKKAYIRPHKHENKIESFHLIEGSFFLIIFDQAGKIKNKILMSDKDKKGNFLCRLDRNIWHMVIPVSDFAVFHEVTNGPYRESDAKIFASWAPKENNKIEVKEYIKSILESDNTN